MQNECIVYSALRVGLVTWYNYADRVAFGKAAATVNVMLFVRDVTYLETVQQTGSQQLHHWWCPG